jgi:SAM-dependent methyltransferase
MSSALQDARVLALARRLPPTFTQIGAATLRAAALPINAARYVGDWRRYRSLPDAEPLRLRDAFPKLVDRSATSPFDSHYFYQDVWAAQRIAERRPQEHVDVGSRVDLVGFLTALCPVVFVDIRPLEADVAGLRSVAGSVLDLPFPDRSVASLSCLHVAEHIGLGRYGDPLDPSGSRRAASELQRVLAPGGELLVSLPVGRPRVHFNAHRVHAPDQVAGFFDELTLVEFSGVDDLGRFARRRSLDEFAAAHYACGMYRFSRPDRS